MRQRAAATSHAPVHARALALAIPTTDDHQVQRVAATLTLQVVLDAAKSKHAWQT